jgi:putative transcriptional regulator
MTKAGQSILRGVSEAIDYAEGKRDGFVAHVPEDIDVRAIRKRTRLSQAKFAATFGFSAAAIRNWEQGRRQPDASARAYLMVIAHAPEIVREALSD